MRAVCVYLRLCDPKTTSATGPADWHSESPAIQRMHVPLHIESAFQPVWREHHASVVMYGSRHVAEETRLELSTDPGATQLWQFVPKMGHMSDMTPTNKYNCHFRTNRSTHMCYLFGGALRSFGLLSSRSHVVTILYLVPTFVTVGANITWCYICFTLLNCIAKVSCFWGSPVVMLWCWTRNPSMLLLVRKQTANLGIYRSGMHVGRSATKTSRRVRLSEDDRVNSGHLRCTTPPNRFCGKQRARSDRGGVGRNQFSGSASYLACGYYSIKCRSICELIRISR